MPEARDHTSGSLALRQRSPASVKDVKAAPTHKYTNHHSHGAACLPESAAPLPRGGHRGHESIRAQVEGRRRRGPRRLQAHPQVGQQEVLFQPHVLDAAARRPRDGERLGPRRRLLPRAAAPVQGRSWGRRRLDEDRFAGRGALAERPRALRDLAGLPQQGRLLPAHESSSLRVCGGAAAAPLAPGRALGEVPGARELGVAQGRGPPVALRGPEPAGPRAVHGRDGVPVGPRVRR